MPSRNKKNTRLIKIRPLPKSSAQLMFWPLVILTLIVWVIYRFLFKFPVWFDETIGKLVFFGLPVWVYVSVSNYQNIRQAFDLSRLKRGLLLGLAFGGLYGFIAALIGIIKGGSGVQAVALFSANSFWWEFFLSLMTGFWESLFFFGFIATVIMDQFLSWPLIKQAALAALIFLIFHLPNTILRFAGLEIGYQVAVLFLFALGQALLFAYRRNGYALVISHAIWGMVLLVHLS